MTRLHPESIRQLRDLIKLHGTIMLRAAIDDIEKQLVAEYEAEARAAMAADEERGEQTR